MSQRRTPTAVEVRAVLFDDRFRAAWSAAADPEWRRKARCRSHDPEMFFPDPKGSSLDALAVCGVCPVRAVCLRDVLRRGERLDGIWGGTRPAERDAMLIAWPRLRSGRSPEPPRGRPPARVTRRSRPGRRP